MGDGTTINRSTPVQVAGISGVVSIAAGGGFGVALKADGTLRAWGGASVNGVCCGAPPGIGTSGLDIVPPLVRVGPSDASFSLWLADPNAFAPLIEAPFGSIWVSNTITLTGIGQGAALSVSGGAYSLNGGAFISTPGMANEGDRVSVRLTAASSFGATNTAVLTAGALTRSFSVSSYSGDTRPNPLSDFTAQTVAGLNASLVSNAITVSGIDAPTPISVTGGQYAVNGGAFTSSPGAVNNGDTITLRLTSAGTNDTLTSATVTIGGASGTVSNTFAAMTQPATFVSAVRQISVAGAGILGLRNDGTVWAWGATQFGAEPLFPTLMPSLGAIRQVSLGPNFCCGGFGFGLALRQGGTVWAWGFNNNGRLGDGTTTDRVDPVQVSGLSNVTAVSMGGGHSLALKSDGTVWAWGNNQFGQVGDGTQTDRYAPVQVLGSGGSGFFGNVIALAAPHDASSGSYSAALRDDGTVWVWGAFFDGIHLTPQQVAGLSGIVAIAAGGTHLLALKSDGTAWALGGNNAGQLGDGTTTNRTTPAPVSGLANVIALDAGPGFSLALKSDGTVWAWGGNSGSQLGDGTTTQRNTPVQVTGLASVASIAAGNGFSVALMNDGTLRAWGNAAPSRDGSCCGAPPGIGTSGLDIVPPLVRVGPSDASFSLWLADPNAFAPLIEAPFGSIWVSNTITLTGIGQGAALSVSGGAYSLNGGAFISTPGMANEGDRVSVRLTAASSFGATNTAVLTAGALTRSFSVSSYSGDTRPNPLSDFTAQTVAGLNASLVSNAITVSGIDAPTPISVTGGQYAVNGGAFTSSPGAVNNGDTITLRLTSAGTNDTLTSATVTIGGASGTVSNTFAAMTQPATFVSAVRQISVAGAGILGLRNDGTVWAWGATQFGAEPLFPTLMPSLGAIRQVSLGPNFCCGGFGFGLALRQGGTVWAWGFNNNGRLGDGTTTDRVDPVQVSGLSNVTAVSMGGGHSLALKSDGTVWAWGNNQFGQVGDGTQTDRYAPVQVLGSGGSGFFGNVIALAAPHDASSGSYSAALRDDGTVWVWGAFFDGIHLTPQQVAGLSGIVAIAAGGTHLLALKSDGTAWALGGNNAGQLGDGTTTNRTTPAPVSGLANVIALDAGPGFSLALKSDGTVWAWGGNSGSQLGDGTTTQRNTPVQVTGLASVASIAAGNGFSVALMNDGTLRAWGNAAPSRDGSCCGAPPGIGTSGLDIVPPLVRVGPSDASFSLWLADPNAFAPLIEAPFGSIWVSNTITLTGIGQGAALSVSGGAYSLNGGAFISTPGMANEGDRVSVRLTAASSFGATNTAVLTAGALTRSFSVSSYSGDTRPNPLSDFTAQTVAGLNASLVSNAITVSGIDAPTPISVTGGQYAVNGGAFTSSPGAVNNGDTITLRLTSAGTNDTLTSATVTIGGASGTVSNTFAAMTQPATFVSAVRQISVAGAGILGLRNDGTVWAWGATQFGAEPLFPTLMPSLGAIRQVSLGPNFCCGGFGFGLALRQGGTVWAWGFNNNGRLGDGTTTDRVDPVQVSGLSNVTAVSMGGGHSLALKSDGTVWAWGNNQFGQVGDGTQTDRYAPVQVLGSGGSGFFGNVIALAAPHDASSGSYSAALRDDGTVWVWGAFFDGIHLTPQQVAGLSGIVAIAAGGTHLLALKSDGTAWALGGNNAGQLGDGTTTNRTTPAPVSGLANVIALDAGPGFSLALKSDGTVWAWGGNSGSQLGDGTTTQRNTPVQVTGLASVASIAAGNGFSVALMNDGTLRAWGNAAPSRDGSCCGAPPGIGIGNAKIPMPILSALDGDEFVLIPPSGTTPKPFQFAALFGVARGALAVSNPITVTGITAASPIAIVGGEYRVNGGAYTNVAGTVMNGDTVSVRVAASIVYGTTSSATLTIGGVNGAFYVVSEQDPAAPSVPVKIAAGQFHTLLLRPDRLLWGFGYNGNGQLGNGSTVSSSVPRRVNNLTAVTAVAAGSFHTLALKSDGTAWAFGWNAVGQIGDGSFGNSRLVAVQVPGLANVISIAAGYAHSLAVTSGGTVWAWGNNAQGQLGDGSTTFRVSPVPVGGLSNVVAVAAGEGHSIALTADGAVWAWGANDQGQLGDGTNADRLAPVLILPSGVAQIAAGSKHTLALRTDGSVVAWGGNFAGQLGDGTTTSRNVSAPVSGLASAVTAIAAGSNHAAAVKAGQLHTWGANDHGQLGDGATANRSTPFAVPGMSGMVAVAGGGAYTVALAATNVLFAFGDNQFGQVGNRTGNYSAASASLNLLRGDSDISGLGASATTSVGANSTSGSAGINTDALGDTINFGAVLVGATVNPIARVYTNNTSAAFSNVSVQLQQPVTDEFALTINGCAGTLAAGASCQFSVGHSPKGVGSRSGDVVITAISSVDGSSLQSDVPLVSSASIPTAPAVSLAPSSLTFAGRNVGTTSTAQTVTLTNTGNATLTISSIAITGTNVSDFGQASSCPSLAPSANCTVDVSFTPSAGGARSASLTVTSNAANGPTNSVTLSGTGTTPLAVTVLTAGNGTGTITSSPAGINCTPTCSASFASGSNVTLTATPAAGSSLISWTGCDSVLGTTCTISSLAGPRSVTATFNQTVQRAFVSATGNNANTATFCAVTAPCKTFAAAVTVVADNGEVVALNTAPYGSVTLTRSISLTAAPGVYAGISVFAGSGVTIASPNISVVLRGLTINGQGGANGIFVDTPSTSTKVSIENCVIANFANPGGAGVAVNAPAQLRVVNTLIRDSFDGISIAGGATAVITGLEDSRKLRHRHSREWRKRCHRQHGLIRVRHRHRNRCRQWHTDRRHRLGDHEQRHRCDSAQGTSTVTLTNSMVTGNTLGLSQSDSATLELTGNNTVRQNATPSSGTITTAPRM